MMILSVMNVIAWSNSLGVNVLVNNAAIFDMAPFLESES